MFRKTTFVYLGLALTLSAACASSPTGATGTPTPAGSSPSTSRTAASAAPATPVSYEPCVLVTAQEASSLTGVNYGTGTDVTANGLKECIYGSQTLNVFTIAIAQAPDLATAQADAAQAQALAQQAAGNGLQVTQINGVGDAAAAVQGSFSANGASISAAGIYVLKGTIFFEITDVAANRAAPSAAAIQAQAVTVLGRL